VKKLIKVLAYVKPYWLQAVISIVFNILSTFFGLFSLMMAIPFLGILFGTEPIVDKMPEVTLTIKSLSEYFNYFVGHLIITHSKAYGLGFISILVVGFSLLKNVFRYTSLYFLATIRTGVIKDIRNALFSKLIELPVSYYSDERKGDIISKMTSDVAEIEVSVMRSLEMLFRDPIAILVYLSTLFVMSFNLTLFVLILLPITGGLIGWIGKSLRKSSFRGQRRLGVLMSIVDETLTGVRIIKAFNAEHKMDNRFRSVNQHFTSLMIKIWRRRDMANPMSEFLGSVVMVSLMLYGGALVLNGEGDLSPQAFMTYLIIFSQIISPAKSFSTAYYNIQKGMASIDRINEILDAVNPITEIENPIKVSEFKDKIEYKNVSFKYADDYVLKNINLTVKKGKSVALVGQSGSGKSTMVDLLPRFWDVTEGNILIDGNPIKDIKIFDLRGLMGNVNQEPILFNDTFFNNIAFGVEDAKEQDVIDAAKVANAHEFIEDSQNGYYTNIGDRGNKLSGGQRQRISIARAVLNNPPILILDEATSALDTESERLVQDALFKLMKNRTSIVIAHRLSTIVAADEICVLHKGEIIEQGTHSELLELNGTYSKLHKMQTF